MKIPVTTTARRVDGGARPGALGRGLKVNVTALFTTAPGRADHGGGRRTARRRYISVFAGRIADAGVDPVPLMREALTIMRGRATLRADLGSPREVLNLVQADQIGCHIITMTHDLLAKLRSLGQGPRAVLARDRADVPAGRDHGRILVLRARNTMKGPAPRVAKSSASVVKLMGDAGARVAVGCVGWVVGTG